MRSEESLIKSATIGVTVVGVLLVSALLALPAVANPARPSRAAAVKKTAPVVWRDDFNGTTLDTTKWTAGWFGDGTKPTHPSNSNMTTCDDPANVRVGGGYLDLKLTAGSCTADGKTFAYHGSAVTTLNKFTITNGTIKARVFVDGDARGIWGWPSLPWTDGLGTWPQTGESDVLEGLSGRGCFTVHTPSGASPSHCASMVGWHTVREVVKNGLSTVYYDDTVVGTEQNVAASQFIIFNNDAGKYGGPTVAPSDELVDWVVVHKTS